jgi:hypothetical protein
MMCVAEAQHGEAMGFLGLAIGAQAAGMLLMGESGEAIGPGATVLLFAALGVGTQVIFWALVPDCARWTVDSVREDHGPAKAEADGLALQNVVAEGGEEEVLVAAAAEEVPGEDEAAVGATKQP